MVLVGKIYVMTDKKVFIIWQTADKSFEQNSMHGLNLIQVVK